MNSNIFFGLNCSFDASQHFKTPVCKGEKRILQYVHGFNSFFRFYNNFFEDYINQLNLLKNSINGYDEDLFIFMHHPLYAEDIHEGKNTWNIDKKARLEIIDILSKTLKAVN